jgi:hypothetical protein
LVKLKFMRTLQNLQQSANLTPIENMNHIKGGKRVYGLVKAVALFAAENREFFTNGSINSAQMVAPNVLRMTNTKGDEICVEW